MWKNRCLGTTSAHAENTAKSCNGGSFDRNYLRARGEYAALLRGYRIRVELPPRTRRIQFRWDKGQIFLGTTSAHAENTPSTTCTDYCARNYLRARGEYMPPTPAVTGFLELPPRTRRIPRSVWPMVTTGGTTSAHAENTPGMRIWFYATWNYLRARGEYPGARPLSCLRSELPPRTRRIPD